MSAIFKPGEASGRPNRDGRSADWNVVVTLAEGTYREARRTLSKWGVVRRTGYYNVLTLTVADTAKFLHEFETAVAESPGILNFLSHVIPAEATFDFGAARNSRRGRESSRSAGPTGWRGSDFMSVSTGAASRAFYLRLTRSGFLTRPCSTHSRRMVRPAASASTIPMP